MTRHIIRPLAIPFFNVISNGTLLQRRKSNSFLKQILYVKIVMKCGIPTLSNVFLSTLLDKKVNKNYLIRLLVIILLRKIFTQQLFYLYVRRAYLNTVRVFYSKKGHFQDLPFFLIVLKTLIQCYFVLIKGLRMLLPIGCSFLT